MSHYKKHFCPICNKIRTFTSSGDGAFHCLICDTRVFYNKDKVVKIEEPEVKGAN